MKKILVLGAGFVASPLVKYLMDQPGMTVTVCDQVESKAEKIVGNHSKGCAMALDMSDKAKLKGVIIKADIVVSLLPWMFHPEIAELCLEFSKHMVTASYVKEKMQALDEAARKKGLLFLNEMGVDPGIDHMVAMKAIHNIQKNGGRVTEFYSYCTGLPALENNNNPMGYKISWSPTGVLMAASNDGRYLENGQIKEIPGEKLFQHYRFLDVPGAGVFESYVNRDALPYAKEYGIEDAHSVYRGTLRYVGYCETFNDFKQLGLLNQQKTYDFTVVTPRQVIADLVHSSGKNLKKDLASYLNIAPHALTLKKLEWLGLLADQKLNLGTVSVFNMFAHILENRLAYKKGEIDLLVQHHEFVSEYSNGKKERMTSTLVDKGIPGGDSSMSRTVGLPAAIGVRLIASGALNLTGVHIPVLPEIYEPVLSELSTMGIGFKESII